ncbi:MAG TPA: DUF4142 domain-containing protein, partial [Burkholderiaceae bacterium]
MKRLVIAALTAAALSGCAGSYTGAGASAAMEAAATAPQSAMGYLANAASGDQFEIQSSQMLLDRSQNAELRGHAQHLIADHTKMSADVMAAARQGGISPPPP